MASSLWLGGVATALLVLTLRVLAQTNNPTPTQCSAAGRCNPNPSLDLCCKDKFGAEDCSNGNPNCCYSESCTSFVCTKWSCPSGTSCLTTDGSCLDAPAPSNSGLTTPALAGIIVGAVIALAVIVAVVVCIRRRKKQSAAMASITKASAANVSSGPVVAAPITTPAPVVAQPTPQNQYQYQPQPQPQPTPTPQQQYQQQQQYQPQQYTQPEDGLSAYPPPPGPSNTYYQPPQQNNNIPSY